MKVLFISDIHGSDEWESIIQREFNTHGKIVFLGDYVDSFTIEPVKQKTNLRKIIELKKEYPEKVTLLLGNHDYAYVFGFSNISGYNDIHQYDYREMFQQNWDLFDIAWGYSRFNNYLLATHAGLTQSFLNSLQSYKEFEYGDYLHETLNYFKDKKDIMWKVGRMRGGSGFPSVLWADQIELLKDYVDNFNQVVGHTPLTQNFIEKSRNNNFLIFIDNRNYVQSITVDL